MIKKYSNPYFTIIIPTFNVESTIEISLKSILKQSFIDFEIVVIDGLSEDDTLIILESYSSKYSNIRVISERDNGIYDAMNKGIDLAKGEWLYFMGADDSFYKENVLQKIYENTFNKKNDVIYGNVFSNALGGIYDGKFSYSKITKINICHQALFFNKRVFKVIGNFDLRYKVLADWDHNLKWFFSSKIENIYIDLIIANYGEGGFSSKNEDILFNRDKPKKIFLLGLGKLDSKEFIRICDNGILYARIQGFRYSIIKWTFLKSLFSIIANKSGFSNHS